MFKTKAKRLAGRPQLKNEEFSVKAFPGPDGLSVAKLFPRTRRYYFRWMMSFVYLSLILASTIIFSSITLLAYEAVDPEIFNPYNITYVIALGVPLSIFLFGLGCWLRYRYAEARREVKIVPFEDVATHIYSGNIPPRAIRELSKVSPGTVVTTKPLEYLNQKSKRKLKRNGIAPQDLSLKLSRRGGWGGDSNNLILLGAYGNSAFRVFNCNEFDFLHWNWEDSPIDIGRFRPTSQKN